MALLTKRTSFIKSLFNLFVSQKQPISLVHFITNRCNARCSFCFINFDDESIFKDELSLDEIEKLTKNIGNSLLNINFTGGEPFARKEFKKIAYLYCKNTTIQSIYITTNGSLPNRIKEFCEFIHESFPEIIITISISIDDLSEKHDKIRKIKGLFNKCIESYEICRRLPNAVPVVQITVSHDNFMSVKKLYNDLVHKYKVDSIKVVAVRDEGVYKIPLDNKNDILNAYKYLVNKIKEDSKSNVLKVYDKKTLQGRLHYNKDLMTYDYVINNYLNPQYESQCPAGKLFGIIDSKGQIFACEILEESIGSLRENNMNFMKIWNNNESKKLSKKIKNTKCNCTYECALTYNFLSNIKYQPKFVKSIFDF